MSMFPHHSSKLLSESITSEHVSPIRKRKVKLQNVFQKRMNKTIEALSRMADDNEEPFLIPSLQAKDFGSIKNMRLSEYCIDEEEVNMSKITGSTSKSVYSGAGIKLDAFDCFHKVLNECVCDFTFSIADAALILKLLTPDIIKKILPLMTQQQTTGESDKQKANKKQEPEYGEEALDYEISEINEQKEHMEEKENSSKLQAMPKRPDASRPTRLSSPGSNSCSPVSAAVQALISISAPLTDNTITQPVMSKPNINKRKDGEISEVMKDMFGDGTVFMPLSKPSSRSNDFSDSVVTPVAKPANATSFCKESPLSITSSCMNAVGEDINVVKSECYGDLVSTSASISSALLDQGSNQIESISEPIQTKLLVTSHSLQIPFSSTNQPIDCESYVCRVPEALSHLSHTTISQDEPLPHTTMSQNEPLSHSTMTQNEPLPHSTMTQNEPLPHSTMTQNEPLAHSTMTQNEPLPHFNLLLNTPSMSVDLPCGLQSPFTNNLPSSPMSSIMNAPLETTHVTTSIKNPLPTIPLRNSDFHEHLIPQKSIETSSMNNHLILPQTVSLSSSLANTGSTSMDQNESFTNEELPTASCAMRMHNPLRTILPKPCTENSSLGLSMASVLSASIASSNSVGQISPIIKLEEKKAIQYGNSIPPNQIFTKLNPVTITNSMPPVTLAGTSTQQRPVFPNNQNCYFSPQVIESFMFPQQQTKEAFRNFFSFSQNIPPITNMKAKTDTFAVSQNNLKPCDNGGKPENGRGNLEVASALLSMGSENDSEKQVSSGEESFQDIIIESLKSEGSNVQVTFTGNGTAKIKDIEIDPQEHQIKKGNFACGKCKRVFTSVSYLWRHIKRVCPDMSQRKWKCDRCTKAFRHPFGLQQHIYTHTGERPHKCNQCAKAFYSSNDLRRHLRTHSGERPYQCTQCEKSFSTTISLKTHNYIHTGERPHKCPHCVKTFATSSKLSRHIVTHSDKRPYPCDQCAKTFNRSGDLRRHYIQHHGKSHALLECDLCNKVFATQKCLINHKRTHNRDIEPCGSLPTNNMTQNEELNRAYDVPRF